MRISTIELLGKKHPLCFSLSVAEELEDEFGNLDALSKQLSEGSLSQQSKIVIRILEALLKAGRIYASASGAELPEPLPCSPGDLIDVTNGAAVQAIFSAISGDTEREVETVPNGEAARSR